MSTHCTYTQITIACRGTAWLAAAEHYGDIRAELEKRGKPLGAMDLMTAAHALSRAATLVSSDVRHFRRVEGLPVANWV